MKSKRYSIELEVEQDETTQQWGGQVKVRSATGTTIFDLEDPHKSDKEALKALLEDLVAYANIL